MASADIIERLAATIAARRGTDPDSSYTARLFAKGRRKIAQKVGEEAVETVIAALTQEPDQLVGESADLLYHLLVLWADCGIDPRRVWAELERREGVSGIAEKQSRKS